MTTSDTLDQKTIDTNHRRHLVNPAAQDTQTMRDSVEKAMNNYFAHLEGQEVTNVYEMVLSEVEAPLLETVMTYVNSNQTRAASMLGMNRGTLRKKLKQYGLD
ncbi:MAG: DNA-binding transcriptional regulator Fis [Endozoicomonadaceae bacterium]|nr:DNA-binding transcriptional regulator Fis [Endozoicomonadaceae bacterium]